MNIIEKMRESNVKLLEAEAKDLAAWSKTKYTKKDIELFLAFNIAEVKFKTLKGEDRTILCTSNMPLIKILAEAKKENKKKIAASASRATGIRTRSPHTIDTWDLVENKRKTVSLGSFSVINFISITPENILILDELAHSIIG